MSNLKNEETYPFLGEFRTLWLRSFIIATIAVVISLISIVAIRHKLGEDAEMIPLLQFSLWKQFILPVLFLGGGFAVWALLLPKLSGNRKPILFSFYGIGSVLTIYTVLWVIQFAFVLMMVLMILPPMLTNTPSTEKGLYYLLMAVMIVNTLSAGSAVVSFYMLARKFLEFAKRDLGNPLYFYQTSWVRLATNFLVLTIGLGAVFLYKNIATKSALPASSLSRMIGGGGFIAAFKDAGNWVHFGIIASILTMLFALLVIPFINRKKAWAFYTSMGFSSVVLLGAILFSYFSLKDLYIPLFKNFEEFMKIMIPRPGARMQLVWGQLVMASFFFTYNFFLVRSIVYMFKTAWESWILISETSFGANLNDYEATVLNCFTEEPIEGMGELEPVKEEPLRFEVVEEQPLSATERMSELNKMLVEGLISQDEFDQKRATILATL